MLPQNEAITIATDVLCEPVARLMKITLSGSSPVRDPVSKKIEKSPSILDDAVTTWKMICRCYQSRYSDTFSSELLKSFAPLLVSIIYMYIMYNVCSCYLISYFN